mgnify:CR=1 FL=1
MKNITKGECEKVISAFSFNSIWNSLAFITSYNHKLSYDDNLQYK